MTAARNLLVELLVEELPPKALKALGTAFAERVVRGLVRHQLTDRANDWQWFASPRRLAVWVPEVAGKGEDRHEQVKLMPASVGLDAEGRATPALLKKLAAHGGEESAVSGLLRRTEGKQEVLFFDSVIAGATLAIGLQAALDDAVRNLPTPKRMQYQLADGWTSVEFVRPAHGLVALHGADVVPVSVLGLAAGRTTRGHRFEARLPAIELRDADSYVAQLRDDGAVLASFEERRAGIDAQLAAAAAKEGLRPIDDEDLRDEVTALVERPNVLLCRFDAAFLAVPPECLVLTMKANQKYFPLLDAQGGLTNRFLVVSNIRPADPARIVEGNERVVRPRLADAKFFFEQDKKHTLESRVSELDKVVYHRKLGSQGERVRLVQRLAAAIAETIGASDRSAAIDRAALLAKADLTTSMVGEFPELQGVMGRYYALADGEQEDVAFGIEDHYRPRFAGDALPRSMVGVVVALADKLATVVALFGIGELPTGDKDPYGLRRQALGIVRLLIEHDLPVGLETLLNLAIAEMPANAKPDWLSPFEFVKERAKGYFEEQGFDRRAVEAVLEPHGALFPLGQLPEVVREASRFIASSEGQLLAEANKRITNILKKSGDEVPFGVSPRSLTREPDVSAFVQDEEKALFASLLSAGEKSLSYREGKQYAQALAALIPLSGPTKAFFDKVMVNVADEKVRENRVTLLQHARAYMNQVADLTLMSR
jgi:glycyl-tRNA synthetase beta chain